MLILLNRLLQIRLYTILLALSVLTVSLSLSANAQSPLYITTSPGSAITGSYSTITVGRNNSSQNFSGVTANITAGTNTELDLYNNSIVNYIGLVSTDTVVTNDTSTLNVSGGLINTSLITNSTSTLNISGGSTYTVLTNSTANATFSGGSVYTLTTNGGSRMTMSGSANSSYVNTYGTSQLDITNGLIQFGLNADNSSIVNFFGGIVTSGATTSASTNSTLNISGGSLDTVEGHDSATIKITGGSIASGLYAHDTSKFNIYGKNLSLSETSTTADYVQFTMLGTLSDGTSLGTGVSVYSYNLADPTSSIALFSIVPEPSDLILMVSGLLLLTGLVYSRRMGRPSPTP